MNNSGTISTTRNYDLCDNIIKKARARSTVKLVFFISFITFFNYAYSQNNYKTDPTHYYNFKDTNNYERESELIVPKVEIVCTQLIDSLEKYIYEVEYSEYEIIDNNGIYIQVILSFLPDDTANIWFGFIPLTNYYLDYNISRAIEAKNVFSPKGYRMYLYGCVMFEDYLVCIETNENVNKKELSRFFYLTNEYVTLHIYKKEFKKMDNFLPRMYFSVPLENPVNYVSPVFPR